MLILVVFPKPAIASHLSNSNAEMHKPNKIAVRQRAVTMPTPSKIQSTPPPAQATPAPTPVVSASYATGCLTYDSLFRQYSWNVAVAEAICQAESGGNPYAVSSTNDYGLMQLHDEEIFNPSANIAGAYRKYVTQGWEAWTTYNTGAYYRYL